jgi:hypothetical protein
VSFAARALSSSSTAGEEAGKRRGAPQQEDKRALVAGEEQYSAITDRIPQRPVGPVEGASYTILIAAGAGPVWDLTSSLSTHASGLNYLVMGDKCSAKELASNLYQSHLSYDLLQGWQLQVL